MVVKDGLRVKESPIPSCCRSTSRASLLRSYVLAADCVLQVQPRTSEQRERRVARCVAMFDCNPVSLFYDDDALHKHNKRQHEDRHCRSCRRMFMAPSTYNSTSFKLSSRTEGIAQKLARCACSSTLMTDAIVPTLPLSSSPIDACLRSVCRPRASREPGHPTTTLGYGCGHGSMQGPYF